MANSSQEPRKFDAVKGRQVPPVSGAVLGGIEGLRQRFTTGNEQVRLDAVVSASTYGDEALDILVKALKDASLQVRVKAYQILKESNQAESETAKGLRLNVGDKIYCVYRSSLSYGDDLYYLVDSINDYYDDDNYNEEDDKYDFYEPLLEDEDGYLHYITDITDNINTKKPYHWIDNYDRPLLESFHVDENPAREAAKYLHSQRLLELDEEIGNIDCQLSYDTKQLNQWCHNQNLFLKCKKAESSWEFQNRIFRTLQKRLDIELINRFWGYTLGLKRLAFVHQLIIDRKCYLQSSFLDTQQP